MRSTDYRKHVLILSFLVVSAVLAAAQARPSALQIYSIDVEGGQSTLLVSPTSRHVLRNWRPERYAAVMDHAATRGWRVVLVGGPSELERSLADAVIVGGGAEVELWRARATAAGLADRFRMMGMCPGKAVLSIEGESGGKVHVPLELRGARVDVGVLHAR